MISSSSSILLRSFFTQPPFDPCTAMSRTSGLIAHSLTSFLTSNISNVQVPAQFATRSGTPNGRGRRSQRPETPAELRLPSYADVNDIQYPDFVRRLESLNPEHGRVDEADAQKALQSTFVGLIGRKRSRQMKKGRRGPRMALHDEAEWKRLKDEESDFWQGERAKRAAEGEAKARIVQSSSGRKKGR